MRALSHIIATLMLAIISTAALARPPLYTWIPAENIALPKEAVTFDKGKRHSLHDFKGNVVVLNLWATWCTPCLEELPTLDKLEQTLAKEGLVVVPLSVDNQSSFKVLRDMLDGYVLALPHLAYDHAAAFSDMARYGLPTTLLIDREGKVRYQFHGATDWMSDAQLDKIRALLAERKA